MDMKSGIEVDVAVARALGHDVKEVPGHEKCWIGHESSGVMAVLFTPSSNLLDAWRPLDHFVALEWDVAVYSDENGWHCLLEPPGDPEYTPLGMGLTPELAICDAILQGAENDLIPA